CCLHRVVAPWRCGCSIFLSGAAAGRKCTKCELAWNFNRSSHDSHAVTQGHICRDGIDLINAPQAAAAVAPVSAEVTCQGGVCMQFKQFFSILLIMNRMSCIEVGRKEELAT